LGDRFLKNGHVAMADKKTNNKDHPNFPITFELCNLELCTSSLQFLFFQITKETNWSDRRNREIETNEFIRMKEERNIGKTLDPIFLMIQENKQKLIFLTIVGGNLTSMFIQHLTSEKQILISNPRHNDFKTKQANMYKNLGGVDPFFIC
jgi:hypothetical protein